MKTINHLTTEPASRFTDSDPEREGNKNTRFADLIIDGQSLYGMLKKYDLVPALGWGREEYQRQIIDYFLLRQLHPVSYYRYPLLVCPWCGDEECGFISVWIEREGDYVVWKEFKLEPGNQSLQIGPYYFKWDDYEAVIQQTLGAAEL